MTKIAYNVSADNLKELLIYSDGDLWWKSSGSGRSICKPLGCVDVTTGYARAMVLGKRYYLHRLVWAHQTGAWPSGEIDHIDGNKTNNKICNLREASRCENMRNIPISTSNKSGFKGVSWDKGKCRWVAQISIDGKGKRLGRFKTAVEAHKAYVVAAEKYHGEFARLK